MAATQTDWLRELQGLIANKLDPSALKGKRVCAILGDVPSTYAKSPKLWNAAFAALKADAVFVPLDIPRERLAEVLRVLRSSDHFLGGSVTVPYKMDILPLLDAVDPLAARIGAVNAFARMSGGKLTGYNTDGLGGLRALTAPVLPGPRPTLPKLEDASVLLLGAGGAAQAVAVYLWEHMRKGQLRISNRTSAAAHALVKKLSDMRPGRLEAIADDAVPLRAPEADLIVNASVKGQSGIRKLADGSWTCLEPYSALGPANPAALAGTPGEEAGFFEAWHRRSWNDIRDNNGISLEAFARIPKATVCYDIIYSPLETVFLRQARLSGHGTVNGKEMNVIQAVEAFTRYVCRDWLSSIGLEGDALLGRVAQAMAEEWAK